MTYYDNTKKVPYEYVGNVSGTLIVKFNFKCLVSTQLGNQ